MPDKSKIIAFVSTCEDEAMLRNVIRNARKADDLELETIAFKRLISLVPSEVPGTVDHDLWANNPSF
jgi:hypothetical protein